MADGASGLDDIPYNDDAEEEILNVHASEFTEKQLHEMMVAFSLFDQDGDGVVAPERYQA